MYQQVAPVCCHQGALGPVRGNKTSGMKKALLLPGAKWQVAMAERLKAEGVDLTVVDPHPEAPCVPLADHYFQADLRDEDRILDYCRTGEFDAVISDECDIAMPLVAKIGAILHLPTLSVSDATIFTDKYEMRCRCRDIGIPCPDFQLCETVDEVTSFFRKQSGPIVMKPVDANASRGVFVIRQEDEIRRRFCDAISFSRKRKAILAETYVQGREFTIDGMKTAQSHITLAISEKKHYDHNPNVASELLFTHSNDNFDYEALKKANDRFVNGTTLAFGLTHAEYKFQDGKFYQIEIAARGGGTMISSLIAPYMSGIDSYSYLMKRAFSVPADEIPGPVPADVKDRAAVLKFFDVNGTGGRVRRIIGEEFLKRHPAVKAYQFNFSVGDVVGEAATDSDRPGFYIACCKNRDELSALMEQISQEVHFEYEDRA